MLSSEGSAIMLNNKFEWKKGVVYCWLQILSRPQKEKLAAHQSRAKSMLYIRNIIIDNAYSFVMVLLPPLALVAAVVNPEVVDAAVLPKVVIVAAKFKATD